MNLPTKPGYYLFKGFRRRQHSGYIETIHAPVQIIPIIHFRKPRELAVKMIGRQQAYPLSLFEGEWSELSLEPLPLT